MTTYILSILLVCSYAAGQTTGEVRGKVVDSAGKSVVSAFVIITGQDTSLMRAASTDENGEFAITAIPVGSYSVQVTSEGFHEYAAKDLRVSVGQAIKLQIILGVTESKAVSASASHGSLIEASNAQLGVVMDSVLVSNLPLKSRDTFDLLQLQPGVQSTVGADLFFGGDRPGVVSVNGGRVRSNSYSVNGGHSGDLMVNSPSMQPSPDAISEFRVMSHNYDAQLGLNSGSVLNVITKSGAGQFHGTAYEYLRNTALNSRGYFDTEKPKFNQNDFGGTIGGPIRRDKTFFFTSYERRTVTHGISSGSVPVPTLLERGGDFSSGAAFAGTLQDDMVAQALNARPGCAAAVAASGGAPIAPGTAYADIFPGNVIPTACFDRTAAALLTRYVPQPTFGMNEYRGVPLAKARNDQATLRLDHNLGSQQHLGFYYYGDDGYQNDPFARFQGGGAKVPGFGSIIRDRYQQFNLSHEWTINARTNNELRLVYYRGAQGNLNSPQHTSLVQNSCGTLPASQCFSDPANPQLGITPGLGSRYEGLPFINLAGEFAIGNNRNGWFAQKGNVYQVADNYTKVLGRHTIRFGADLRNQRLSQSYLYDINGNFEFTGGGPNDAGYDNLVPNFLLGLPDVFSQGSGNNLDVRTTQAGLFAQDAWKLQSNLTLNYGLRWELNTPQADAGKRVQEFRPGQTTTAYNCVLGASNPLAAEYGSADCSPRGPAAAVFPLGLVMPGDNGISSGLTKTYYRSFAPRLGLAWSPNSSQGWLAKLTGGPGRSSLRMGWGMYYDSNEELIFAAYAAQPPFGGSTYLTNPFFNTPFLGQSGTINPNPFGGFQNPARGSDVDFSLFRPLLLFGNYPDTLRSQYAEQYHLTFQRELPQQMLLQVGYVGSQGHRLIATYDANYGNAQTCLDLNKIPGQSCGPYGADTAYNIPAGAIPAGVTLHLPYGQVSSVTGPNPTPITLVGLRRYSSPLCHPTTGAGCPSDGVPVFSSVFTMAPVANSSYNALQALLTKRFSRLRFVASYTFSKSLDNASSFEESVNPLNPAQSRSMSLFDSRHRFVLSGYWQLPEVHTSNWTRHALSGWAVSGIATVQSGFPIRITSTSDRELMGSYDYQAPGEPDLVAPFRKLEPRRSGGYYFDPSSFADAPLGQIGSAPRTLCCGPGIGNIDAAIHKSFTLSERARMQFNTEIFNLFNHTQFMNPEGDFAAGASFGQVQRARDARLIQFALRLTF